VARALRAAATNAHARAVALEARQQTRIAATAPIQARVEQRIIEAEGRISLARMARDHHQRVEDFLQTARDTQLQPTFEHNPDMSEGRSPAEGPTGTDLRHSA
jgi:hypothetical protein